MPINQDLYDILIRLWKQKFQGTWVFYNKKTGTRYKARPKMMKSICKRAEIPHFGFHALRHFMASYLADTGKQSIKTIQSLLRHKNMKTTEIYLQTFDGRTAEAVKGIEGKFVADRVADLTQKAATKTTTSDKRRLK